MNEKGLAELLLKFQHCLPGRTTAAEVLQWCNTRKVQIIEGREIPYLKEIARPPKLLFIEGNSNLLFLPSIAIVGTRRPSASGEASAFLFGRELARLGHVVVSGLARGIDRAAHEGALAGGGFTIAVLGHGLDRVYPMQNASVAREIIDRGGCLVSEYPPFVPPLRHHFPERNRIIAGLSLGTLVVEAAEKSGSLITAQFAVDQGREVFVLPGPHDDPAFRGGHFLIQQGASLVLSPQELVDNLGLPREWRKSEKAPKDSSESLFRFFKGNVETLDTILAEAGDEKEQVYALLESALSEGKIIEVAPQQFAKVGR